LDRSVYGPLKKFFNASCDSWLMSNPRPMTIYDISSIVNLPYSQAFTPKNIKAGFAVAGIEPYNRNVFDDDEFLGSAVTDRPTLPSMSAITAQPPVSLMSHLQDNGEPSANATTTEHQPSTTGTHECQPQPADVSTPTHNVLIPSTLSSCSVNTVGLNGSEPITPEDIMPFPKAAPRKNTGARRAQKTRILTDTPERQLLAAQQKTAKRKGVKVSDSKISKEKKAKKSSEKNKTVDTKNKKNCATAKPTVKQQKNVKNRNAASDCDSTSDDEPSARKELFGGEPRDFDDLEFVDDRNEWEKAQADSDSADDVDIEDVICRHESDSEDVSDNMVDRIKIDDFIVVQLKGLSNVFHSICQVTDKQDDLEVRYLNYTASRCDDIAPTFTFQAAASDRLCRVPISDVVKKLPAPMTFGGTKRVARKVMFAVPLNDYNFV